jgi:hypothetical protein
LLSRLYRSAPFAPITVSYPIFYKVIDGVHEGNRVRPMLWAKVGSIAVIAAFAGLVMYNIYCRRRS